MWQQTTSDSGIAAVGPLPWGTHFCQFYKTRDDLVDTLVPYITAGLENNEACMWVTSNPLQAAEARAALSDTLPNYREYEDRGQLEILDYQDWYLALGNADADQVLGGWVARQEQALEKGYTGFRLTGNTFWLERSGWNDFVEYERKVNETFWRFRIIALCTYSLERCCAEDVIDVVRNHQFALTRRGGDWELTENSSLKIAKEELQRVNADLDHRVQQRTADLEAALHARDEFLAMLSHEIRNPLAAVSNACHLLRLPGLPAERAGRLHDVTNRQLRHLTRLVDDLLDVARISRGQAELAVEDVDLREPVQRAVEAVQVLPDAGHRQFEVSLPADPLPALADAARVEQAVSNVLHNALKYTDPHGRIQVSLAREGEQGVIRVTDDGRGIPAAHLARIFEPFTQGDTPLARTQGGLGIGLTVVRHVTELHGGKVEAHSEGPGQGAEFLIRLPLLPAASPAAVATKPPVPAPAAARMGVLVVEDNLDTAATMADLLDIWGYHAWVAHDGATALALVTEHAPQIVLLDIGLPDMDGYQIAHQIGACPGNHRPLLVALTGYGQTADRTRALEAGFDHHLVKPLAPETLREFLQAVALPA